MPGFLIMFLRGVISALARESVLRSYQLPMHCFVLHEFVAQQILETTGNSCKVLRNLCNLELDTVSLADFGCSMERVPTLLVYSINFFSQEVLQ